MSSHSSSETRKARKPREKLDLRFKMGKGWTTRTRAYRGLLTHHLVDFMEWSARCLEPWVLVACSFPVRQRVEQWNASKRRIA